MRTDRTVAAKGTGYLLLIALCISLACDDNPFVEDATLTANGVVKKIFRGDENPGLVNVGLASRSDIMPINATTNASFNADAGFPFSFPGVPAGEPVVFKVAGAVEPALMLPMVPVNTSQLSFGFIRENTLNALLTIAESQSVEIERDMGNNVVKGIIVGVVSTSQRSNVAQVQLLTQAGGVATSATGPVHFTAADNPIGFVLKDLNPGFIDPSNGIYAFFNVSAGNYILQFTGGGGLVALRDVVVPVPPATSLVLGVDVP